MKEIEKHERPSRLVFKLHSTCRLVPGGAYSAIYDLERGAVHRFSSVYLGLIGRLADDAGLPIEALAELDDAARERAGDAIAFVEREELGSWVSPAMAARLPPIEDGWSSPHAVLNALIDVDRLDHDWGGIVRELSDQQCESVQIRCFSDRIGPAYVRAIMPHLLASTISRVDLLLRWSAAVPHSEWIALLDDFPSIVRLQLHSAPRDDHVDATLPGFPAGRQITLRKRRITGAHHCGSISQGLLSTPSVALFQELRTYNGCLNRKVSIRADGEICNCPSMKGGYGKDISTIATVIRSKEFKRSWYLNKDSFRVCAGCEFRYVCTDCRAYLSEDHSREKPARCGYDPESGRWDEPGFELGVAY